MKFYSGFSLQNEEYLFSEFIKKSEYTICGFSYGAIKALKATEAKAKYSAAKEIDPSQTYPDDRLLVISQLLAEKQSEEENYQMTITLADNLFDQKKYLAALPYCEKEAKNHHSIIVASIAQFV